MPEMQCSKPSCSADMQYVSRCWSVNSTTLYRMSHKLADFHHFVYIGFCIQVKNVQNHLGVSPMIYWVIWYSLFKWTGLLHLEYFNTAIMNLHNRTLTIIKHGLMYIVTMPHMMEPTIVHAAPHSKTLKPSDHIIYRKNILQVINDIELLDLFISCLLTHFNKVQVWTNLFVFNIEKTG